MDERQEVGTFAEKLKYQPCNSETISHFKNRILGVRLARANRFGFHQVAWHNVHFFPPPPTELSPVVGRSFSWAKSSKFCPSKPMDLYTQVFHFLRQTRRGSNSSEDDEHPKRRKLMTKSG